MPPAPNLKLFLVPTSGLDAIDLETVPAAAAICNVYEHEIAIAEYTFNGMLDWVVGLARSNTAFTGGDWTGMPSMVDETRGELAGLTIGCLGYGDIGRAVARRALAFDMKVLALTQNYGRWIPNRLSWGAMTICRKFSAPSISWSSAAP